MIRIIQKKLHRNHKFTSKNWRSVLNGGAENTAERNENTIEMFCAIFHSGRANVVLEALSSGWQEYSLQNPGVASRPQSVWGSLCRILPCTLNLIYSTELDQQELLSWHADCFSNDQLLSSCCRFAFWHRIQPFGENCVAVIAFPLDRIFCYIRAI